MASHSPCLPTNMSTPPPQSEVDISPTKITCNMFITQVYSAHKQWSLQLIQKVDQRDCELLGWLAIADLWFSELLSSQCLLPPPQQWSNQNPHSPSFRWLQSKNCGISTINNNQAVDTCVAMQWRFQSTQGRHERKKQIWRTQTNPIHSFHKTYSLL
jgi:hypothetical protein